MASSQALMAFVLGSVNFSECFNISGDKLILITLQTVLKHVLVKYNIFVNNTYIQMVLQL